MPSSALPHAYLQPQLGIKGRSDFWEGCGGRGQVVPRRTRAPEVGRWVKDGRWGEFPGFTSPPDFTYEMWSQRWTDLEFQDSSQRTLSQAQSPSQLRGVGSYPGCMPTKLTPNQTQAVNQLLERLQQNPSPPRAEEAPLSCEEHCVGLWWEGTHCRRGAERCTCQRESGHWALVSLPGRVPGHGSGFQAKLPPRPPPPGYSRLLTPPQA